jgi:ketosteroid isomerase-like protein
MSQEYVELVRRVYKQVEAQGVEGLLALATDDIVWISDPGFPGGGRQHGKENVRRWLRQLWIYDEVSIDVERIIDLDDGALSITQFHGTSAGAPSVDWPWCHLFAFKDGRISQVQSFLDRAEALEAVGLSEHPVQDNAERVRGAAAAANRRDFDAFVAFVSPDVVWESRSSSAFPGFRDVYRGRAEVREWVAQALQVIEDARTTVEEVVDLGDDRLLVEMVRTGRGKGSGVPAEVRDWWLLWFAGGLITRRQAFWTRDSALEAVRLG